MAVSGESNPPCLTQPRTLKYGLFILLCLFLSGLSAQETDYKKVFGEQYQHAAAYISSNAWMADNLCNYGVDPGLALSIVFPELIRYDALQDLIETATLEVLYVQYGNKYADFSIGRFQMKPSFAEQVEKDYIKYYPKGELIIPFVKDTVKARKARLERLKKNEEEVRYLAMFVRVMEKKYAKQVWKTTAEKLAFYGAAYNAGYLRGVKKITEETKKKQYHTALTNPKEFWCYAAICRFFYSRTGTSLKCTGQKKK